MKTQVELDPQVADFVWSLAPEARRRLRAGLRGLKKGQGDLRPLEGELNGYWRLRVGSYRVLLRFYATHGQRVARCVFAERRSVVYELFAELLTGEAQF
jgi:mRNA interferase RelE/StbE